MKDASLVYKSPVSCPNNFQKGGHDDGDSSYTTACEVVSLCPSSGKDGVGDTCSEGGTFGQLNAQEYDGVAVLVKFPTCNVVCRRDNLRLWVAYISGRRGDPVMLPFGAGRNVLPGERRTLRLRQNLEVDDTSGGAMTRTLTFAGSEYEPVLPRDRVAAGCNITEIQSADDAWNHTLMYVVLDHHFTVTVRSRPSSVLTVLGAVGGFSGLIFPVLSRMTGLLYQSPVKVPVRSHDTE
eukprot:gnl/MRDRNA2_/MRDRNA2_312825_c0_seq1.p1 gnl/MRDRNA2_/MRDRNA2_312825_c0~~gnl/MRDRNA2_/MRDRNA2_312825_c0_seq1.p1  ORF type:complete len:264 (-),score=35.85 gnl/MRDRNA2_/MRDRNA2_312825_c0_seq1:119-829(-)